MDEAVMDALLEAGELLAEAMRAGLLSHGLPGEVHVRREDGRVIVASSSAELRDAESGIAGRPPRVPMQAMMRDYALALVHDLDAGIRQALL